MVSLQLIIDNGIKHNSVADVRKWFEVIQAIFFAAGDSNR